MTRLQRRVDGTWVVLAGALLLAGVVRFWQLGEQDYWVDELHALVDSAGKQSVLAAIPYDRVLAELPDLTGIAGDTGVADAWRGMRQETHPPLYFLLLYGWRSLVGDEEFAVRALSAALSVLSVIPVFLTLRAYGRAEVGAAAACVLAAAFGHIYVGQQNRQYSLALGLVACAYWFWARFEGCGASTRRGEGRGSDRRGSGARGAAATWVWSALYGAALLAAMLTHYIAALPLAGHAVYVLARGRGRERLTWATATIAAAGTFLLLWGPQLAQQFPHMRAVAPVLAESGPQHEFDTLVRFANVPLRLLFHLAGGNVNPAQAAAGCVLMITVLLALHRRWEREAVLFGLWFAVPVAFLGMVDITSGRGTLGHLRYPVFALPGLVVLLVLAARRLPRRGWVACVCGITILSLVSLSYPTRRNPDARVAAELLAGQMRPGDLLVCDGTNQLEHWPRTLMLVTTYYLPRPYPPLLLLSRLPSAALMSEVGVYGRLFVVSGWSDQQPWVPPPPYRQTLTTPWLWDLGPIRVYERQTE